MERFKLIDHPSDIGIIAYGKTQREIFENAAFGMFSLMTDLDKVTPKQIISVKVLGDDPQSLLVNWLNELVSLEDAKKMLFRKFTVKRLSDTALEAEVCGEKIDPKIHKKRQPIKAATYSQLQLDENQATIIFDV
ncbi:MAG: archease [Candidatus Margulisbacteria bacterium]|nr:archease [Candidatus Margulisiibacteriota bacterium]